MNIIIISLNTFREAIRNKALYSVLMLAVLLVAISALFGSVTLGDKVKVIKDFGLFCLSFFGSILTIVIGVSLLNKEIKQKTIYNILSKPVHRTEFIIGKYIGLTITACVLITLLGLGLILFTSSMEGQIDYSLFIAIAFTYLELIIIAAVTIFFSSLVVTTTLTGLFTMSTYIAGRSISYLSYFFEEETKQNHNLTYIITILDKILPDLSHLSIADNISMGLTIEPIFALNAIVYSFSYSAILIILACAIFNKRELV